MAIFEEVKFRWGEETYTVPPEAVLRCIAAVEATGITLGDLIVEGSAARLPLARLSQGMGAALRFAGAKVTNDEVYDKILASPGGLQMQAISVTVMLHKLMIPPQRLRDMEAKLSEEEAAAAARAAAAEKPPAGTASDLSTSATSPSSVQAS